MNLERDGIETLRGAVEELAGEIERKAGDRSPRRPVLRVAVAAAVMILAILIGYRVTREPQPREVEVLVLRIQGKPAEARLVDGAAPSTIIIMPRSRVAPVAATVALRTGGPK